VVISTCSLKLAWRAFSYLSFSVNKQVLPK
jgi:hypothetical protein